MGAVYNKISCINKCGSGALALVAVLLISSVFSGPVYACIVYDPVELYVGSTATEAQTANLTEAHVCKLFYVYVKWKAYTPNTENFRIEFDEYVGGEWQYFGYIDDISGEKRDQVASCDLLDYGEHTIRARVKRENVGDSWHESNNCTVTIVKVEITVDLEDLKVNNVRSGLDENTLRFELNGTVIPKSSLTLERTTETVDGEEILTNLVITYVPSCSELILPGTNTVKVDIDDMVDNHMDQIVETFDVPSS